MYCFMQTLKVCSRQLVSAIYVTATAGDHGHSRVRPGPGDELCSAAKKHPEERGGALTNAALFRINRRALFVVLVSRLKHLAHITSVS